MRKGIAEEGEAFFYALGKVPLKLALSVRKAFWLSLFAIGLGDIPPAQAQPIPVPEILPLTASPSVSPPSSQEPAQETQSFRQRWTWVAQKFQEMEAHPDYATGFLVSKELRSCQCTRPEPWAVLRGLDEGKSVEGGTDESWRCGFCVVQKYTQWQERVSLQCGLMLTLSLFELERLEKSEDAQSLPKRCFERARSMHKPEKGAVEHVSIGEGNVLRWEKK